MTVVKISESQLYIKFQAIRKAGFDLEKCDSGWVLIDKKYPNADRYIDTYYRSVDEALMSLSDVIMRNGYLVVA